MDLSLKSTPLSLRLGWRDLQKRYGNPSDAECLHLWFHLSPNTDLQLLIQSRYPVTTVFVIESLPGEDSLPPSRPPFGLVHFVEARPWDPSPHFGGLDEAPTPLFSLVRSVADIAQATCAAWKFDPLCSIGFQNPASSGGCPCPA